MRTVLHKGNDRSRSQFKYQKAFELITINCVVANHLTPHHLGSDPLRIIKTFSVVWIELVSIYRVSPSLQPAGRAAASICGGNEDSTDAKGKGYNEVGGEEKQVECLEKKVSTGSGIMKRNIWLIIINVSA